MSLARPLCEDCSVVCDCEYVAWYSHTRRDLFAVAWRCPSCSANSLAVSPLGPVQIGLKTCLQCGAEGTAGETPCPQCGASLSEVLPASQREMSDDALLALAREAFALGTCRRGLTIANYVLQRNTHCQEATQIKVQFVEHLDRQEPFS